MPLPLIILGIVFLICLSLLVWLYREVIWQLILEKLGHDIATRTCDQCGRPLLAQAKYCAYCGRAHGDS